MSITESQFKEMVTRILPIYLEDHRQEVRDQIRAIEAAPSQCLFIVAGPGSGKTTVLALRTLRFVFVDGIEPSAIVSTTFTRKAAKELRSRILSWGDELREAFITSGIGVRRRLERVDFNAVVTGTLDSVAHSLLAEHRRAGSQPPVVIEEFVSRGILLKTGLFAHRRYWNQDLNEYLRTLYGGTYGLNASKKCEILQWIRERLLHDSVSFDEYVGSSVQCPVCGTHPHPGIRLVQGAIEDYVSELEAQGVLDYPELEHRFLRELQPGGLLQRFATGLQAILIDEYQDTNLLQEQIYFTLARWVAQQQGGITVVGDDDQSLFRFRGATVDLFRSFSRRLHDQLGLETRTIFLRHNWRSAENIVDHCNRFIQLDQDYDNARVEDKPPIVYARNVQHNPPVLGLFREDAPTLAAGLSGFIRQVFYGEGVHVPSTDLTIRANTRGSVGDCALLCHSPAEFRGDRVRLPRLVREQLEGTAPRVPVFNPKGQDLAAVTEVGRLCGLILECIDPSPDTSVQSDIASLPRDAISTLDGWRAAARRYVRQDPPPRDRNSLQGFVRAWQDRQPQSATDWPRETHLADLAYKLVTWIPQMQNDVEGLVYLEVILRTITESARFSSYGGRIVFGGARERSSIRAAIWDILVPIATGAVEVDEDLLETLPRDRLNILSIHQSKGLEFPMVIVDVGSDFRSSHWTQARFRFPRGGSLTHRLEDGLRQFSPLDVPDRSPRDRAFDDLLRLYFVAFSRAMDVLVLVGLDSARHGIPNIATGWDRTEEWHWGPDLSNLTHI